MKKYILLTSTCILMMSVAFVVAKTGTRNGQFDTSRFLINDYAKTAPANVTQNDDDANSSGSTTSYPSNRYITNRQVGKSVR